MLYVGSFAMSLLCARAAVTMQIQNDRNTMLAQTNSDDPYTLCLNDAMDGYHRLV